MAIQIKIGGAYVNAAGIFAKIGGVYVAIQGVFAKVGGAYQPVLSGTTPQPAAPSASFNAASNSQYIGAF